MSLSAAWWTNRTLPMCVLLLQSGELYYALVTKPLKISAASQQQRFMSRAHTAYVPICKLAGSSISCRHSGILGWWNSHCLEPSWWLWPRERALEGCRLAVTCSSRQWTLCPFRSTPVARTMAPPAQEGTKVQSPSRGLEREPVGSADDYHTSVKARQFYLHVQNLGAYLWMTQNIPVENLWLNLFLVPICWDSSVV